MEETILRFVMDDMARNHHTNSSYPIDERISNNLDSILASLRNACPDCRVYVANMVNGIYDNKTFIQERVRKDLNKFVENPKLCVVVDWSARLV
jgi:hypothetical protein